MKGMLMIDIYDYPILKDHRSSLKETSIDHHHDNNVSFLTDSTLPAVNFDEVKNDYIKKLGVIEAPKSVDALLYNINGDMYFIEFKAGNITNKEYAVRGKVLNSLLIYMDIIKKTADFTRSNLSLIVVYREEKNPIYNDLKSSIQRSDSRMEIINKISEKAKKPFVRFGLDIFSKLYFKQVYTYTIEEFEKNFISSFKGV